MATIASSNSPLGTPRNSQQRCLSLCGLIVRVRVVPRRTVVGDTDRRFDNLSGSHHQSQTTETPVFKPFTVLTLFISVTVQETEKALSYQRN